MSVCRALITVSSLFLSMLPLAAGAVCLGDEPLRGVNIAGAEFSSNSLPGELHHDYTYPRTEELDYFADSGANTIRLPVRWERVQRELNQELHEGELGQIASVLDQAKERGLCLILDIHNYGMYHGEIIGSEAVPTEAFLDLWTRLSAALDEPEYLALGLMNEPFRMDIADWGAVAQQTVDALREAGAEHLIMVSGGRWSGVHEWHRTIGGSSNAETFADLEDPLRRTVIEVHQYADRDYSGTGGNCRDPEHFNAMFSAIDEWAQENDLQLFLGEFGVPSSRSCMAALGRILALTEDAGIWRGWAYWAAGSWWGDYPMSVAPRDGRDAPQMSLLAPCWRGEGCGRDPGAPRDPRLQEQ
ncbi:MAG: glycoside hydrolase family 5 protein [Ectothiorhodospiraceae bacterium]|nr:glycoside hydrolase family 5 protein [Ectothiorhodospiraceae bacterium]MCH8504046.1 glycoside hydrolase family 5 protein [Ectothiorhodospiraceae bacterium]